MFRYSSASAPALSMPVGPPPTTTTFSSPSSSRGVAVAGLPELQDVVLQANRVGQGVHREGVLGRARDAEELGAGAERQDEVVVPQRRQSLAPHLAPGEIDRGHLRLVDGGARVVVEQVAQGVPFRRRLEQVGGDLVEQRLERVIVVLVDDGDVDVGTAELAGGTDAAEAAAENDHVRAPGTGRPVRDLAAPR
jgi:hypothetical protein